MLLRSVVEVKVLGAIELIDEGEIDYKVVVIRISDPAAAKINSMKVRRSPLT